jgi:hypothetical protein
MCLTESDLMHLQVRAIYRVANPRLWGAYARRCAEIAEEQGVGDATCTRPLL